MIPPIGGGCHIQIHYNINSSGWKHLGDSGYVNVMEFGGQSIGLVNISYLVDINLTARYTCQFQAQARPYSDTLWFVLNTDRTPGTANAFGINTNLNYTRLTVNQRIKNIQL